MFFIRSEVKKLKKILSKRLGSDRRAFVFDEIGSTNTYLKSLPEKRNGDVCIALRQNAGRGRGDKSFLSFGEGLYLSLLYLPNAKLSIDDTVKLTCAAAVAVCDSIRKVTNIKSEIKWVNDIYVGSKKISGILTEGDMSDDKAHYKYVIVGIGVNLISKEIPSDVNSIAASLYSHGDGDIPKDLRIKLMCEIISEFDKQYKMLCEGNSQLLQNYRSMSMICGKNINITRYDGVMQAKAVDICDDFTLRVRYSNGVEESLSSGEVSLKII